MTISGLTRGRVFGESQTAKLDIPRLRPVRGPPQGGLSCFWARDSSQIRFNIPRSVGAVSTRASEGPPAASFFGQVCDLPLACLSNRSPAILLRLQVLPIKIEAAGHFLLVEVQTA